MIDPNDCSFDIRNLPAPRWPKLTQPPKAGRRWPGHAEQVDEDHTQQELIEPTRWHRPSAKIGEVWRVHSPPIS